MVNAVDVNYALLNLHRYGCSFAQLYTNVANYLAMYITRNPSISQSVVIREFIQKYSNIQPNDEYTIPEILCQLLITECQREYLNELYTRGCSLRGSDTTIHILEPYWNRPHNRLYPSRVGYR